MRMTHKKLIFIIDLYQEREERERLEAVLPLPVFQTAVSTKAMRAKRLISIEDREVWGTVLRDLGTIFKGGIGDDIHSPRRHMKLGTRPRGKFCFHEPVQLS